MIKHRFSGLPHQHLDWAPGIWQVLMRTWVYSAFCNDIPKAACILVFFPPDTLKLICQLLDLMYNTAQYCTITHQKGNILIMHSQLEHSVILYNPCIIFQLLTYFQTCAQTMQAFLDFGKASHNWICFQLVVPAGQRVFSFSYYPQCLRNASSTGVPVFCRKGSFEC